MKWKSIQRMELWFHIIIICIFFHYLYLYKHPPLAIFLQHIALIYLAFFFFCEIALNLLSCAKKMSKKTNYSPLEDEHLCQIYMEISQDPVIGTNQSLDRFWSRVEVAYNSSINDEWEKRSNRSLQSRMQAIEKAVKKLKGCVRQVENYNPSGASDKDIVSIL